MEITKMELKILIKDFLSASNRILRARFEIYPNELLKFVKFLESRELIYNFIKSCGETEYDVETEVKEVCDSYGRCIFSLGTTEENEVANIYAVIKYLAENNYNGNSYVFFGYSSSRKFQDKVNAFGDEFIRILITHIENYLTKVSIQMGLDDKATVNVKIENSNLNNTQVNVANDGSTISTSQNICNTEHLQELIDAVLKSSESMSDGEKETINDCLEVIETIKEEKPKKGIIRMALNTLSGIAGTAEFVAAVAAIVQFVQSTL